MTQSDVRDSVPGKPRLAFMGEFSAGKSTLTNLLVGQIPMPTRVTATRLPPVWISNGDEAAFLVSHDGTQTRIDIEELDSVSVETTAMIRLFQSSDTLELCDIIDMPGISDPNMSPQVWKSIMPEVDSVVWCTHATQAWRQSEAAVWDSISDAMSGTNILLVTHFDKLLTPRDRSRVIKRVSKETKGQFDAIFPISLSQAMQAEDDAALWQQSGAERFIDFLVEALLNQSSQGQASVKSSDDMSAASIADGIELDAPEPPVAISSAKAKTPERETHPALSEDADAAAYVVPRRVRLKSSGKRPRAETSSFELSKE